MIREEKLDGPSGRRRLEADRPLVIYALYSGKLYGTERMALATLTALRCDHDVLLLAPPGEIHEHAARNGVESQVVSSRFGFARVLASEMILGRHVVLFATRVLDSFVFAGLRRLFASATTHFHIVHGGSNERDSYGRKRKLRHLDLDYVGVSAFVRERLVAHGVPRDRIHIVENFLPPKCPASLSVPAGEVRDRAERVVVVSRLDPVKQLGRIFDAHEIEPRLAELKFRIYGTGSEEEELRKRAKTFPNVQFRGFDARVREKLRWADLYLHTCPSEPFGLSILEAFEAGIPVVIPGTGGASEIVRDQRDGLHFDAADAHSLARVLLRARDSERWERVAWAESAQRRLRSRYGPERGAREYRELIAEVMT